MQKIYFKKSLGQNFLYDKNIIKKIIEIGKINSNSHVLEIGPGTGNLTIEILKKKPKKLYLFEKDKNLVLKLKEDFSKQKNLFIVATDALKVDEKKIINKKVTVFGNLPYNISTQLLAKWITLDTWPPWYSLLVLMFQKEVADRILAEKNSKNYGRISILSNWRLKVKKHFDVSKNCFYPKPKINSTVLSFQPIQKINYNINNPAILENITRIFFSSRRKMINKPLQDIFGNNKHVIKKLNLNLKNRPENLSCEMYYKIAQEYEKLIS